MVMPFSPPDPVIDTWFTIVAECLLQPDSPAIDGGRDLSSGGALVGHIPSVDLTGEHIRAMAARFGSCEENQG